MRSRNQQPFSEVVAQVAAAPARRRRQRAGRSVDGATWIDPAGTVYALVATDVEPARVSVLAGLGAAVVYDACGCGGVECKLDWLTERESLALAAEPPPRLHPTKDGLARLAEYRADGGQVLIDVTGEVSWGSRIQG